MTNEEVRISEAIAKLKKYHFTRYSEKALEGYFRFLSKRNLPGYQNRTQSFWLAFDESEEKEFNSFPLDFMTEVKKFIPEMQERHIKEIAFLQKPEDAVKGKDLQNTILFIYDVKDEPLSEEDLKKWEAGIELLEDHPEMTRFLVTTLSIKENRFKGAPDIYYRKFRQEVETPTEYSEKLVYHKVLADFLNKGFTVDDAFSKGIKHYIDTVLPTADLSREPFVQDMIERIWNEYQKQPGQSMTLNDKCVPYYKKQAAMSLEIKNETKDVLNVEESNQSQAQTNTNLEKTDHIETEEKIWETILVEPFDEKADSFEIRKDNPNILILALSTFASNFQLNHYRYNGKEYLFDNRKTIEGPYYYQLEPIPKLLIDYLEKQGEQIDEIIMICTPATVTSDQSKKELIDTKERIVYCREDGKSITEEDFFVHSIKQYIKDKTDTNIRFTHIDILLDGADWLSMPQTCEDLLVHVRQYKNPTIYIDIHGGPREAQDVINAMLYALRWDQIIIDPNKILTANFDNKTRISEIKEAGEGVVILDFISGMNEFIQYGRVDSLSRYVKETKMRNPDDIEDVNKWENLVHTIETIALSIQLCNVPLFEKGIIELRSKLNEQRNQAKTDNYLKLFLDNVEKEFKSTEYDLFSMRDGFTPVIDEIRWCIKKGFYQQALTIIESRIPSYLFEKGIVGFDHELIARGMYYKPNEDTFNWLFNNTFGKLIPSEKRLEVLEEGKEPPYKPDAIKNIRISTKKEKILYDITVSIETDSNTLQRDNFKQFFIYHYALKKLRNDSSHINFAHNREDTSIIDLKDQLINSVEIYIRIIENLIDEREKRNIQEDLLYVKFKEIVIADKDKKRQMDIEPWRNELQMTEARRLISSRKKYS